MASIADGQPLGVIGNWIEDGLLQRISYRGKHKNLSSKIFHCEDLFDGRVYFAARAVSPQVQYLKHNVRNRIVKLFLQETILVSCQSNTGEALTNFWLSFGLIKVISCPCSTSNV